VAGGSGRVWCCMVPAPPGRACIQRSPQTARSRLLLSFMVTLQQRDMPRVLTRTRFALPTRNPPLPRCLADEGTVSPSYRQRKKASGARQLTSALTRTGDLSQRTSRRTCGACAQARPAYSRSEAWPRRHAAHPKHCGDTPGLILLCCPRRCRRTLALGRPPLCRA
jgi:hypothetical protein